MPGPPAITEKDACVCRVFQTMKVITLPVRSLKFDRPDNALFAALDHVPCHPQN